MQPSYNYYWPDVAFSSKKPIKDLNAIFIAAPREISVGRFTQIIKENLPKGNILLGLATEKYIDGFDGQIQFKTLSYETIKSIIDKVNNSNSSNKIYTLRYFQRDLPHILEKISFKKALFVNGSWHRAFHVTPVYYQLVKSGTSYQLISPFCDEEEAKVYAESHQPNYPNIIKVNYSAEEMLDIATETSKLSFDYVFQVGVALGKKSGGKYKLLDRSFNKVVPYQTYAMHFGSVREARFSPPNDQGYYDTVHAETELIIQAQKGGLNLAGTTVFINVLPCPSCARMFCDTDISEFVYSQDHSDGYAVKMLEAAGKKVTRIVR